jgi:hypothetical protein
MIRKIIFFAALWLMSAAAEAQTYMPNLLGALNDTLNENSALLYFDGSLWTINDGGNSNILYRIDTAAPYNIRQKILLPNAPNRDWEALTQSNGHIFIGDFGNNNGNRQNLMVFRLAKSDILAINSQFPDVDTLLGVDSITFSYSDQASFANLPNNNNFDCEAFVFYADSLHLFSKNWQNNQCKHYVLPADTGNFSAQLRDSFNTTFLVTDASIDSATGNLILVGYSGSTGSCSAYLFFDYADSHFFGGQNTLLSLPHALQMSQLEGVALYNGTAGWTSGERFQRAGFNTAPRLFGFDFSAYFPADTSGNPPLSAHLRQKGRQSTMEAILLAYPNPADTHISLIINNLNADILANTVVVWRTIDGRLLQKKPIFLLPEQAVQLALPTNSPKTLILQVIDASSGQILGSQLILRK